MMVASEGNDGCTAGSTQISSHKTVPRSADTQKGTPASPGHRHSHMSASLGTEPAHCSRRPYRSSATYRPLVSTNSNTGSASIPYAFSASSSSMAKSRFWNAFFIVTPRAGDKLSGAGNRIRRRYCA